MAARILIVDDHEAVREGVRTLIGDTRPDWDICGEASDGEQAVEVAQALQPDVVVLDLTMPKMSGFEAATRIAELKLRARVLIFTMHESDRLEGEVRAARAHGFVIKSQAARDLVQAIDCVLAGGTFFGASSTPS
jgi:DNA-binding NarL/FixJ family response regulator